MANTSNLCEPGLADIIVSLVEKSMMTMLEKDVVISKSGYHPKKAQHWRIPVPGRLPPRKNTTGVAWWRRWIRCKLILW